ncbi:MAG TPA: hypothetical protein PLX30_11055 [Methanothrix sp.]|nr:hypothetical protein [Methanothrix sp.]
MTETENVVGYEGIDEHGYHVYIGLVDAELFQENVKFGEGIMGPGSRTMNLGLAYRGRPVFKVILDSKMSNKSAEDHLTKLIGIVDKLSYVDQIFSVNLGDTRGVRLEVIDSNPEDVSKEAIDELLDKILDNVKAGDHGTN